MNFLNMRRKLNEKSSNSSNNSSRACSLGSMETFNDNSNDRLMNRDKYTFWALSIIIIILILLALICNIAMELHI